MAGEAGKGGAKRPPCIDKKREDEAWERFSPGSTNMIQGKKEGLNRKEVEKDGK